MSLVELQGVKKTFPGKVALKGVSLSVEEGEIFGLMGPSGSGKTTLLRLINLLDKPTEGRIYFHGMDVDGNETQRLAARRRIGMVFQQNAFFNDSVFENVAYGLRVMSYGEDEIREEVRRALELVGVHSLRDRRAKTLSGGEAQRVAVARVLPYKPELILLDEPTANLDPANVKLIEEAITRINREEGATFILVTHNPFQAKRIANRVGFLLEGELIEVGETAQVFSNPANKHTEAFITGQMVY